MEKENVDVGAARAGGTATTKPSWKSNLLRQASAAFADTGPIEFPVVSAPAATTSAKRTEAQAQPVTSWKGMLKAATTTFIGEAFISLFAPTNMDADANDRGSHSNSSSESFKFEVPSGIDAAYVGERVLVAGPARRARSEKDRYRNDPETLRSFLNRTHGDGRVLYFDLAGPNVSGLSIAGLNYDVVEFDLERPTLEGLRSATEAVREWLELDPSNVAVLTCSNGIKSTMLVAACICAQLGVSPSTREGLRRFFATRLGLKKPYSTLIQRLPPSYDRLMRLMQSDLERSNRAGGIKQQEEQVIVVHIITVAFRNLPLRQIDGEVEFSTPMLRISSGEGLRNDVCEISPSDRTRLEFVPEAGLWFIEFDKPLGVRGDVCFSVFLTQPVFDQDENAEIMTETPLFQYPFHSAQLHQGGTFEFGPDSMDEEKRHALPGDFSIELVVRAGPATVAPVAPKPNPLSVFSAHHVVQPDPRLLEQLVAFGYPEPDARFALQRSCNDVDQARDLLFTSRGKPKRAEENLVAKNKHSLSTVINGVAETQVSQQAVSATPKQQRTKPSSSSATPVARRAAEHSDEEQAALSPFLRETIGRGLNSARKSLPSSKLGSSSNTADRRDVDNEEMDRLLMSELASLIPVVASVATHAMPSTPVSLSSSRVVTPAREVAESVNLMLSPMSQLLGVDGVKALLASSSDEGEANLPTLSPGALAADMADLLSYTTSLTMNDLLDDPARASSVEEKALHFDQKSFDQPMTPARPDLDERKPTHVVPLTGQRLGEDPTYATYFRMIRMGVPLPAVKQRMIKDGQLPQILDLGPDADTSLVESLILELNSEAATKTTAKKPQRPKTIHFEAIPDARLKNRATIWTAPTELADLDTGELAELFMKPIAEADAVSVAEEADKAASLRSAVSVTPLKSILDPRRLQSVAIGLAKLRSSEGCAGPDVIEALRTMNAQVLRSSVVQIIQGCGMCPTMEEIRLFHANTEALTPNDEFMAQMATIPDVAQRIEALSFRYAFDDNLESTLEEASKIEQASHQVRNSPALKDILRVVLVVGNKINNNNSSSHDGSDADYVKAFTMASLLKLSQTKSLNRSSSVLEYLVSFLKTKMPSALAVSQELSHVSAARKVQVQVLDRQVRDLRRGLSGGARFGSALSEFAKSATRRVDELEASLAQARESFSGVLEYFGEDESMSSCDFFETLHSFLVSFETVKTGIEEKEARARRVAEFSQLKASTKVMGTSSKPSHEARAPLRSIGNQLKPAKEVTLQSYLAELRRSDEASGP